MARPGRPSFDLVVAAVVAEMRHYVANSRPYITALAVDRWRATLARAPRPGRPSFDVVVAAVIAEMRRYVGHSSGYVTKLAAARWIAQLSEAQP